MVSVSWKVVEKGGIRKPYGRGPFMSLSLVFLSQPLYLLFFGERLGLEDKNDEHKRSAQTDLPMASSEPSAEGQSDLPLALRALAFRGRGLFLLLLLLLHLLPITSMVFFLTLVPLQEDTTPRFKRDDLGVSSNGDLV